MKLFYSPGACSLAADIVLHEAQLDATFIKVDLKSKKTEHGEDYAAITPKGYVPALMLDDGNVVTENIAVLLYLASLKRGLLPEEGIAKWHAIEALAFVSTELHKSFKPIFTPSAPDAAIQTARETLAQRFGLLANQLGDREFLVGDAFTIVDAYAFVMLRWAGQKEVTIPAKLADYAARLKKRASVQAALTNEGLT